MSSLKFEDFQFDLLSKSVDEQNWDREKWRKENPMDYIKAVRVLDMALDNATRAELFQTIYQIVRLHIPDVLYKYYSLSEREESNERKFKTLLDNKIYMADITGFNDPFDGKGFFYNPAQLINIERLKPHGGRWIDDFNKYIKASSLTENGVQSMPMWAHYAGNHAGFCVSYDMGANPSLSSCTFPVQYTDERIDMTSFMREKAQQTCAEIDRQIAMGRKEIIIDDLSVIFMSLLLCNLKHTSWSYEKEFRCTTSSAAKGMPYIEAKPKEIYIGMNCAPTNAKHLLKIGDVLKIPVYKMDFDECTSNYELTAKSFETN